MSDEINTLDDWQSNDVLVAWAKKSFSGPRWELLVKVMERDQHVRHFPQEPGCDAVRKLGRVEGWDLFYKRLMLFAVSSKIAEMPEPTFSEPEQEPA